MSIAQARDILSQIVWMLRDMNIPDKQARTRAEMLADKAVHDIDDNAPSEKDVVGLKRQPDGDVVEA